MSDTQTVDAASLVSDLPPKPRKKLTAADFPGIEIKPAYPGAKYGRHPITKQFVSLGEPPPEPPQVQPPAEPEPPPDFKFEPAPEMPLNTGPEPQPEPPPEPPRTEPQQPPGATEPPPPDFSDLGGTGPEPETQAISAEPIRSIEDFEAVAGFYFDTATTQFAVWIGPEWNAASDAERLSVVKPLAKYLQTIQAKEPPPWLMAAGAIGFYSMRRFQVDNTKNKLAILWLKIKVGISKLFGRMKGGAK